MEGSEFPEFREQATRMSGGPRPWAIAVIDGYPLSSDDLAAVGVWVELSRTQIEDSDQAYWVGSGQVMADYRNYVAARVANAEPVMLWEDWQTEMAEARYGF